MSAQEAFDSTVPLAADRDAEQAVIGSIMQRRGALDEVLDIGLSSRHFYYPANETIFAAMVDAGTMGQPTDPISMSELLLSRGDLDRVGGQAYLHACFQSVLTSHNVDHWATIVFEGAVLRHLREAGTRITQMSSGVGEGDVNDIVSSARNLIDEVTENAASGGIGGGDAIAEALDLLTERKFVKTPWREMNNAIGGWVPGHLTIIGARPSVGKTTVATNLFLDCLHRGWYPVFISLEMPKGELILKILSAMASVSGDKILHRSLTLQDEAAMDEAARRLRAMPFTIDDRSNMSVQQVRAVVRAAKRHGLPVLLIGDYLQIFRPADKHAERYVQVGDIAQGFKNLARDEDVPAILLAQLKRGADERAVPVPVMADLRESGGIEQAADTIALLHRQTRADLGDPRQLDWFIGKSRFGRVTQFSTEFDGEFSRITDRAPVIY